MSSSEEEFDNSDDDHSEEEEEDDEEILLINKSDSEDYEEEYGENTNDEDSEEKYSESEEYDSDNEISTEYNKREEEEEEESQEDYDDEDEYEEELIITKKQEKQKPKIVSKVTKSNTDCKFGNLCKNENCNKSHPCGFCMDKNTCIYYDCSLRHTFSRRNKCTNKTEGKLMCSNIQNCKFLHPSSKVFINKKIWPELLDFILKSMKVDINKVKATIEENPIQQTKSFLRRWVLVVHGFDSETVLKKIGQYLLYSYYKVVPNSEIENSKLTELKALNHKMFIASRRDNTLIYFKNGKVGVKIVNLHAEKIKISKFKKYQLEVEESSIKINKKQQKQIIKPKKEQKKEIKKLTEVKTVKKVIKEEKNTKIKQKNEKPKKNENPIKEVKKEVKKEVIKEVKSKPKTSNSFEVKKMKEKQNLSKETIENYLCLINDKKEDKPVKIQIHKSIFQLLTHKFNEKFLFWFGSLQICINRTNDDEMIEIIIFYENVKKEIQKLIDCCRYFKFISCKSKDEIIDVVNSIFNIVQRCDGRIYCNEFDLFICIYSLNTEQSLSNFKRIICQFCPQITLKMDVIDLKNNLIGLWWENNFSTYFPDGILLSGCMENGNYQLRFYSPDDTSKMKETILEANEHLIVLYSNDNRVHFIDFENFIKKSRPFCRNLFLNSLQHIANRNNCVIDFSDNRLAIIGTITKIKSVCSDWNNKLHFNENTVSITKQKLFEITSDEIRKHSTQCSVDCIVKQKDKNNYILIIRGLEGDIANFAKVIGLKL